MRRLIEYWTVLTWVAFTCSAQVTTWGIVGLVLDPSGTAVPNEAGVILNLETNSAMKVSIDQAGGSACSNWRKGPTRWQWRRSGSPSLCKDPSFSSSTRIPTCFWRSQPELREPGTVARRCQPAPGWPEGEYRYHQ
jgi:hypothetical protein